MRQGLLTPAGCTARRNCCAMPEAERWCCVTIFRVPSFHLVASLRLLRSKALSPFESCASAFSRQDFLAPHAFGCHAVEASSSAQIAMAAFEYSSVETTLSRILSPLQSAQLMDKVALLMATSVEAQSIQFMSDRIRFFSFLVLDKDMSRQAPASVCFCLLLLPAPNCRIVSFWTPCKHSDPVCTHLPLNLYLFTCLFVFFVYLFIHLFVFAPPSFSSDGLTKALNAISGR